jgi:hypothetical protein
MELETLRQLRRALSAAVALAAVALVMVKVSAPGGGTALPSGALVSMALLLSVVALVVVWRKEHAANEAAFAARERAQLALLKLQLELAKKKQGTAGAEPPRAQPGDAEP